MQKVDKSRINRVKKKSKKKWVLRVLTIVSLVLLGIGLYFGSQIWGVFANSQHMIGKSNLREKEVEIQKEPFTVLLIGTDQRKSASKDWRADVLMVAAVNPKTNSVKILSIPRDTYVKIANTNGVKTKINAAAVYGYRNGVDPVQNIRETVENLLHIPIDHYALINFQGFEDIVDAVGGVEVNVQFPFMQRAIGGRKVYFEPGIQHLNGPEALAYVRMRKQDPKGDIGRNERQREVITKLVDKLASIDGVTKFSEITEAVGQNFKYSFEISKLPALINVYRNIPKENIETIELQVIPEKIPGQGDVLILKQEERDRVRQILQQQIDFIPQQEIEDSAVTPDETNSEY